MKQHTTPEQTAKLIKLGLPKPRYYSEDKYFIIYVGFEVINYSIGELIEILDNMPNNMWNFTRTSIQAIKTEINVFPETKKDKHLYKISYNRELIDALYDIIVKLKEEEVK